MFRLPVVFESDKNALLMADDSWLTERTPHGSPYVFGILSAHAEGLLKRLEGSKSTRGRVESLLSLILHTGEASMDVIAGKLGAQPPDALPQAEGGGRDLREGVG